MSDIASLASSDVSSQLQQLTQQTQQSAQQGGQQVRGKHRHNHRSGGDADQSSSSNSSQFKAQFDAAAQANGLDPKQLASLHSQFQDAIQSALKSSDGSTDRKSVVQNAIDGVLKSNGIDPASFNAKIEATFKQLGISRPGAFGPGAGGSTGGVDSDGDHDGSSLSNLPSGALVDQQA